MKYQKFTDVFPGAKKHTPKNKKETIALAKKVYKSTTWKQPTLSTQADLEYIESLLRRIYWTVLLILGVLVVELFV